MHDKTRCEMGRNCRMTNGIWYGKTAIELGLLKEVWGRKWVNYRFRSWKDSTIKQSPAGSLILVHDKTRCEMGRNCKMINGV